MNSSLKTKQFSSNFANIFQNPEKWHEMFKTVYNEIDIVSPALMRNNPR